MDNVSCLLFSFPFQYFSRILLRTKGQVQLNIMEEIHVMKFKFVFIERGHYQVTLADLLRLHLANDANVKKAQFHLVNKKN